MNENTFKWEILLKINFYSNSGIPMLISGCFSWVFLLMGFWYRFWVFIGMISLYCMHSNRRERFPFQHSSLQTDPFRHGFSCLPPLCSEPILYPTIFWHWLYELLQRPCFMKSYDFFSPESMISWSFPLVFSLYTRVFSNNQSPLSTTIIFLFFASFYFPYYWWLTMPSSKNGTSGWVLPLM